MRVRDRVGGRVRIGAGKYTPLNKNGIKKTQNKSMENTIIIFIQIFS